MTGRILQLLLGVIVFICSTPQGMAQKTISEEVLAPLNVSQASKLETGGFFVGEEVVAAESVSSGQSELGDEAKGSAALAFNDLGLIQFAEGEVESESSVDSEEDGSREHERTSSHKLLVSRTLFNKALAVSRATEGDVRYPERLDVREQRTATIRFLQRAALAC